MWKEQYQEVPVVLSGATLKRLEQPCPNKRRVPDYAVELIRVAIFQMFPPKPTEDWRDRGGLSAFRAPLLLSYDYICFALRRGSGRGVDSNEEDGKDTKPQRELTLKIPVNLIKWIDRIA